MSQPSLASKWFNRWPLLPPFYTRCETFFCRIAFSSERPHVHMRTAPRLHPQGVWTLSTQILLLFVFLATGLYGFVCHRNKPISTTTLTTYPSLPPTPTSHTYPHISQLHAGERRGVLARCGGGGRRVAEHRGGRRVAETIRIYLTFKLLSIIYEYRS